jgi:hypothetical protein
VTTARQQHLAAMNTRHQAIEKLLEDLTKPTYVWRMARAMDTHGNSAVSSTDAAIRRSARVRRRLALDKVAWVLSDHGYEQRV